LLHQSQNQNSNTPRPTTITPSKTWKNLWRLKLPNKLITFTWKLIHKALPIKAELIRREIHCDVACSLCNTQDETFNHLFLHCPFSRAVWLGVGINTSPLLEVATNVETWISKFLESYGEAQSTLEILHMVITTTWGIWLHTNQVIFEGKQPNPTEVLLTIHSLVHRYNQIPHQINATTRDNPRRARIYNRVPQDCQLLILTAVVTDKTGKWQGISFIGKNRAAQIVFVGCQSLRTENLIMAKMTAIREASLLASRHAFGKVVILTNSKGIEQMWQSTKQQPWQLFPFFADLKCFQQLHGLQIHLKAVHNIIIQEASSLAIQATKHFVNVVNYNSHV
jgi:hypothetical protein